MRKKIEPWLRLKGPARMNAKTFCSLGSRVSDWLDASPVIALVPAIPQVCSQLKLWAAGGWRTRSVVAALGLPVCLRKLDAEDVSRTPSDILPFLVRMSNEKLGKHISEWGYVCDAIKRAINDFPEHPESSAWMIDHARAYVQREQSVKDYFRNVAYRWDWSPNRIAKEHDEWAKSMRTKAALSEASKPEHMVEYNTVDNPLEMEVEGIQCRLIKTTGQLILEGAAMQHCVGGQRFQYEMRKGEAVFYHLESDEGVSTIQFVTDGDSVRIGQHCGVRNVTPPSSHVSAREAISGRVAVPVRTWVLSEGGGNAFRAFHQRRHLQMMLAAERLRDERNPMHQQAGLEQGALGGAIFNNQLFRWRG